MRFFRDGRRLASCGQRFFAVRRGKVQKAWLSFKPSNGSDAAFVPDSSALLVETEAG